MLVIFPDHLFKFHFVCMGFPCGSAGKESVCNGGELGSIPGLERFPWRKERLPASVFWPGEFHGLYSPWSCNRTEKLLLSLLASLVAQTVKSLPAVQGSIPGLGKSPGEGNGEPLQYPYLENPMDGGAWWATVHGMANSRIWLSDFTLCMYVYQLEYQNHQLVVCEWGFIQETG